MKIDDGTLDCVGENSLAQYPPRKIYNFFGRVEHEAILRDRDKMIEMGLDPDFERMVYLHRWGEWLTIETKDET